MRSASAAFAGIPSESLAIARPATFVSGTFRFVAASLSVARPSDHLRIPLARRRVLTTAGHAALGHRAIVYSECTLAETGATPALPESDPFVPATAPITPDDTNTGRVAYCRGERVCRCGAFGSRR